MRELLNAPEAAKYLRVKTQSLARMRWEGTSPPFIKLGRRVLYDLAEIDRWLDLRRRRSTSDPGPVDPT